jgi:hypothetical protein
MHSQFKAGAGDRAHWQTTRQDGHGCLLRPPSGYDKHLRTLALLPCHRILEDVTASNIAVFFRDRISWLLVNFAFNPQLANQHTLLDEF